MTPQVRVRVILRQLDAETRTGDIGPAHARLCHRPAFDLRPLQAARGSDVTVLLKVLPEPNPLQGPPSPVLDRTGTPRRA